MGLVNWVRDYKPIKIAELVVPLTDLLSQNNPVSPAHIRQIVHPADIRLLRERLAEVPRMLAKVPRSYVGGLTLPVATVGHHH